MYVVSQKVFAICIATVKEPVFKFFRFLDLQKELLKLNLKFDNKRTIMLVLPIPNLPNSEENKLCRKRKYVSNSKTKSFNPNPYGLFSSYHIWGGVFLPPSVNCLSLVRIQCNLASL